MNLAYSRAKLIEYIFDEIKEHYGKSEFFEYYPTLTIFYDPYKMSFWGEFRDDYMPDISLNIARCRNFKQIVGTLIHEYKHYLQDPVIYQDYCEKYNYTNNPFELEANDIASKDINIFMELLKKRQEELKTLVSI